MRLKNSENNASNIQNSKDFKALNETFLSWGRFFVHPVSYAPAYSCQMKYMVNNGKH